ncbi:salicylate synthase [Streptomyces sp. NRRL S-1448]|uniref:salicylate synthase n=1 Tax=Streptomyces sp. NRRL S-1448 TaxID=1463883 RepID=UPI001EFFF336|nr:salicylate synthase [Streptomyces sp. NRRL S-1448]
MTPVTPMAPVTPTSRHSQQLCLDGPFDPLAVVAQLTASGLLTDYVVYEQDEHWHIAGNPVEDIRLHADDVRTTPWESLRAALARTSVEDWHAYGWLSFELASGNGSGGDEPLGHLIVPGVELTVSREQSLIRALDPSLTDRLRKVIAEAPPHAAPPTPVPVDERATDRSYHDQVAHAVAEIGRGRLDKVILSRTVTVPYTVDMTATYVRGRAANTPARSFLLDLDGLQAAGFSPETVIEVTADGSAVTQPLAGTRALHGDPATDRALRAELFRDPKEVYEHATSVKLAVEELSTVGAPDTTRVSEFLTVKPRGSVQHLASRVATQLADGRTAWDALGAVFPPVTASGIPKAAAYRLIHELEDEPRGMYAGAVLRAGADGSLDAALVLRAVYQCDGRAWLRAGAGVVGASSPDREYEETCEKLRSVAPYVVPEAGH